MGSIFVDLKWSGAERLQGKNLSLFCLDCACCRRQALINGDVSFLVFSLLALEKKFVRLRSLALNCASNSSLLLSKRINSMFLEF